jgi:hypothetical protein
MTPLLSATTGLGLIVVKPESENVSFGVVVPGSKKSSVLPGRGTPFPSEY